MTPGNLITLASADTRRLAGRLTLLGVGIAVGVGALLFMLALVSGLESLVLTRVVGVVPDRLEVSPGSMNVGMIKLNGASLDDAMVARLRAIPGVTDVYRRARLPIPSQLTAHYANFDFLTDIIIEGADEGMLKEEFGDAFTVKPPGAEVPAVLPTTMINLLNAGLNVHTGLPQFSDTALIGLHFYLLIGHSSFRPGWADQYRAKLIGISDKVVVSGPTVPMGYLEQWVKKHNAPALTFYSAVLALDSPQHMDTVAQAVQALGLTLPSQEKAAWISSAARAMKLALGAFAAVILFVAGIGIANGFGMMVQEESTEIGLMRALGARRLDILSLYLARALVLGFCGAAGGILFGYAGCRVVGWLAARSVPSALLGEHDLFLIPPWMLLLCLAFGVGASILGGLFRAGKAAGLNSADALRGA